MRTKIGAVLIALGAALVLTGTAAVAWHANECVGYDTQIDAGSGNLNLGGLDDCVAQANPGAFIDNTWTLGGGTDFALGGPGTDNIQGEGGADIIAGETGSDTIRGGDAGDILKEGPGDPTGFDHIFGGNGDDNIIAGRGTDYARGEGDFDTIQHYHCGGNDDLGGFERHIDIIGECG